MAWTAVLFCRLFRFSTKQSFRSSSRQPVCTPATWPSFGLRRVRSRAHETDLVAMATRWHRLHSWQRWYRRQRLTITMTMWPRAACCRTLLRSGHHVTMRPCSRLYYRMALMLANYRLLCRLSIGQYEHRWLWSGGSTPWAIKCATLHLSISSPIIDWFFKFFHWHTLQTNCNNVIIIPPRNICLSTLPCEI